MRNRHYCYLEGDYFPMDQFTRSGAYGLVHMTENPHTDLGTLVDEVTLRPLPDVALVLLEADEAAEDPGEDVTGNFAADDSSGNAQGAG